jgi:hypothetical protein
MPNFLTASLADILNKNKILTEAGPAFKSQDLKAILSRSKEDTETMPSEIKGTAVPKSPKFKSANLKTILNREIKSSESPDDSEEISAAIKSPRFKNANLAAILHRKPGMTSEEEEIDTAIKSPKFKGASLDTILKRKPGDTAEETLENAEEDNELEVTVEEEEEATVLDPNLDWRQEHDDRLAENEEATGSKRKSQAEVEKGFWNDFFITFWSKELIKPLHALGAQFKLDILKRGFSAQDNDLLAFLQQEGIKNNILKNKLLKEQTYAVLHNATMGGVTSRKLRTADLVKPNKYNLIYNADWYKLNPTEMTKYLELQQEVLSSSLSIKQKEKVNRLIFLADTQIKNKTTSISEYAKEVAAKLGQSRARIPTMKLTTSVALNSFADATCIAQSLGVVGEDYKPEIEIEGEKAKKTAARGTKNANSIFSAIHSTADIRFAAEKLFEYTHEPAILDFSDRILSKYPRNKKEEVSNEIKDKMTQILQSKNGRFEIDYETLIKHFTKKLKEFAKK